MGILRGICRKVIEFVGEVVEFFIIVFIIICFKFMVVVVCVSCKGIEYSLDEE